MGAFLALAPIAVPSAQAFSLGVHRQIVRDALSTEMDDLALSAVTGYYLALFGAGNLGSDLPLNQLSAEQHFDNVRSSQELCSRWSAGFDRYVNQAVDLAVDDPQGALDAFGHATHAIADFYAHTTWVEQNVERGDLDRTAPLAGGGCSPSDFSGIQSGYFDLAHGIDGCPGSGPPEGYLYCHSQIAKDDLDKPEGRQLAPDGRTYHRIAVALATRGTAQAWHALEERIRARYGQDPTVDVGCVWNKLAFGGREETGDCRRIQLLDVPVTDLLGQSADPAAILNATFSAEACAQYQSADLSRLITAATAEFEARRTARDPIAARYALQIGLAQNCLGFLQAIGR